jgi:transposase
LAEARAGQRTLFFVDAAHFVVAAFLGWLWCVARLYVRGASGRQRYNVLGALNAITRELVRVTNHTYITAETVCDLLRQIAALGLTTPITLVMDNARYPPNLNLIERLWKFVKKQALNSRHHTNYADFHARIDQCLHELSTKHKAEMETLLTPRFQTFDNVPLLSA